MTFDLEIKDKKNTYTGGVNAYSTRTTNLDDIKNIDVIKLWMDANYIYDKFLIRPSFGLTEFRNRFADLYGISISYFPKDLELTFTHAKKKSFLVYNDGLIGSVFKQNENYDPQEANHYSFLIKLKNKNTLFDII